MLQVQGAPISVTEMVKSSVCAKVSFNHISKPFYNPCCTLNCKDICGSTHRKGRPKCQEYHQVRKAHTAICLKTRANMAHIVSNAY